MSRNSFSLGSLLSTASVAASLAISLSLVTVTAQSASAQTTVYAGGATFPSLLYRAWFDQLEASSTTEYEYAGTGSSAGIRSFLDEPTSLPGDPDTYNNQGFSNSDGTAATPSSNPPAGAYPYPRVDIGATDSILNSTQINTTFPTNAPTRISPNSGTGDAYDFVQVPTVAGPVNIAYNRSGLNTAGNPGGVLRLSRQAYCGIFSGRIRNWNNTTITASNRGTQVSANLPITVVVRSDGSGTTDNLTTHLVDACNAPNDFTQSAGTTTNWPAFFIQASGSSGVVAAVALPGTSGAGRITYTSPSFVAPTVSGGLPSARLQTQFALNNAVDQYAGPTVTNVEAALRGVTLPADPSPADYGNFSAQTVRPNRSSAYPIIGITYLLLYGDYSGASGVSPAIKSFVDYYTSPTSNACSIANSQIFACFTQAIRDQIQVTVEATLEP